MAQYYLNLCLNTGVDGPVIEKANVILKELHKSGKKFRVIKSFEEEQNDKYLNSAETDMLKGNFEHAIDNYLKVDIEKLSSNDKNKVRSGLSFAYFFTGKHEKGIELSESAEEKTVQDLCNLLLLYFYNEEKDKLNKVKTQLLKIENLSKEETYKIAISFAHIKEHLLAKKYLEKVLKEHSFSLELDVLYAISCINCGDKELAKRKLIDFVSIDPENSYIYKKYLNICDKQNVRELDYVFGLQYNDYTRVNHMIKTWTDADIDLLSKMATENVDFLYYIAKHISGKTRNLLLLKLCSEGPLLNSFFEDILLENSIDKTLKIMIIKRRMEYYSATKQNYVVDDYYNRIAVPYLALMRDRQPELFSAVLLSSEFLMENFLGGNLSLKTETYLLEKAIEKTNSDFTKYMLAAIICWLFVRDKNWCTLKKICSHFVVDEKNVLDALDKLGL